MPNNKKQTAEGIISMKIDTEAFDKEKHVEIAGNSNMWEELSKQKYAGEANLFFTLRADTEYINNRKEIYDSQWEKLQKHAFPKETRDTYLKVVDKARYAGKFTNDKSEQIKRIVRYGDAVTAELCIMPDRATVEKEDKARDDCSTKGKEYREKEYYFRLYENKKGDDVPVASEDKFSFDNEGFYRFAIDTGEKIREDDHPAETPFLPRLFYYCIYDSKENADKNRNEIYSYPEEYGIGKKNDGYFVNLYSVKSSGNYAVKQVVAIAGEEAVQEAADKQSAKEIEKLKIPRNYFLQLKVAKETTANKSIGAAAVKIGEALEKEKKCYCGKEHIDLRGKLTFSSQGEVPSCKTTCDIILSNIGISSEGSGIVIIEGRKHNCYYQLAVENTTNSETFDFDTNKVTESMQYIDAALESNYPVVVGVDYIAKSKKNIARQEDNDWITDHFVIIVGRHCENNNIYYRFWDVGTHTGATTDYKFILDKDNHLTCSDTYKGNGIVYTVTQVRRILMKDNKVLTLKDIIS
jgi:hypothetical protein